jgi:hypothetical protein
LEVAINSGIIALFVVLTRQLKRDKGGPPLYRLPRDPKRGIAGRQNQVLWARSVGSLGLVCGSKSVKARTSLRDDVRIIYQQPRGLHGFPAAHISLVENTLSLIKRHTS